MQILSKLNNFFERISAQDTIALDFGTANTRIAISGKGIVNREPTFIGLNTKTNKYLFFGQEARDIYGKTPNFISIITPVENAIISDFDASVALVTRMTSESVHAYYASQKFFKKSLSALTCVPINATEVEQRAAVDVLTKAGFANTTLIPKPIASALGAGVEVFGNTPSIIVDMGAGIFEISIIIMGGVSQSKIIKTAGNYLDRQIVSFLHLKSGLIIGELTAQEVKTKLFSLANTNEAMMVRGKSVETGLPKQVRLTTLEVKDALIGVINVLVEGIKELIENAPPEVLDGIVKKGIVLTGGGSYIPGIDTYIEEAVKFPVTIAPRASEATILGLMKLMNEKELIEKVVG